MTITMADRPLRGLFKPRRALLPMLIGLAFAPWARADVNVTPSVSIRETWTDNVNLSTAGQERSQFITELAPALALSANNQRVQLAARYQFRQFFYSNKDAPNLRDSGDDLQADLKARLVDDLLFLDATANRGQQTVSAFGQQFSDNPYSGSNRTEVSTWRVSPYLTHRFGSSAVLLARYTRDSVSTGRDGYGDTDGDSYSLSLSSPNERRIGWNLRYDRQDLRDKLAGESSTESISAGLSWRLLPSLVLTGGGGYDDNDYSALGGRTRGGNWNLGFQYTPSQRTSLTASIGHRYFGKSRALSAMHRSRQTVWNISFDEAVTTTRSQFLLPSTVDTFSLLDRLFAPNFPDPEQRRLAIAAYLQATGLPPVLTDDVNYLSNRYMLQKQFQASVGLRGARSTLLLSLYDTRREALSVAQTDSSLLGSSLFNLNDNTRQRGLGANFTYRLSSRASAYGLLNAARSNSLSTGIRQTTRGLRVGLQRQFQRTLQGNLELRRLQGSGTNGGISYTENAISATLSTTF